MTLQPEKEYPTKAVVPVDAPVLGFSDFTVQFPAVETHVPLKLTLLASAGSATAAALLVSLIVTLLCVDALATVIADGPTPIEPTEQASTTILNLLFESMTEGSSRFRWKRMSATADRGRAMGWEGTQVQALRAELFCRHAKEPNGQASRTWPFGSVILL